jgi:hypothetical protein
MPGQAMSRQQRAPNMIHQKSKHLIAVFDLMCACFLKHALWATYVVNLTTARRVVSRHNEQLHSGECNTGMDILCNIINFLCTTLPSL